MIKFIPAGYENAFGSFVFLLGFFGIIALFLAMFTKKRGNEALRKLQDAERNANMTATKPLPDNLIYHINIEPLKLDDIDYSSLDSPASERIEKQVKSIKSMENLEFVYNDHTADNLSIKEQYGPVTLQRYIELEHAYDHYTQMLNNLTTLLYTNGLVDEAETIALELFKLNSSVSSSYIVLCDIYLNNNDFDKLNTLKTNVENAEFFNISEYSRKKVLNHIGKLL